MERKMGLLSRRAFSKASSPQGYQSTGLCACCSRYGLFSCARRLVCMIEIAPVHAAARGGPPRFHRTSPSAPLTGERTQISVAGLRLRPGAVHVADRTWGRPSSWRHAGTAFPEESPPLRSATRTSCRRFPIPAARRVGHAPPSPSPPAPATGPPPPHEALAGHQPVHVARRGTQRYPDADLL